MPCNPIHKQIKRSSSRSFWAAVFLSGNGNMDGNLWKIIIKAQERKTVRRMCQKPFFPCMEGLSSLWIYWGDMEEIRDKTLYIVLLNKK